MREFVRNKMSRVFAAVFGFAVGATFRGAGLRDRL